ncbi:2-C-methyl-D-erythritol 4-phosphate cytidylyltransferase [Arthrobacter cheniae]|uniref:2-C-methyl-D-erythritol 4-phosphate cytidylyltransferase n=1 Tax=Arthrobacter cheniae TaxID=1258888 RepID=A0A3A5M3M4_9MICC|nr:2-C-methyl-D-erythritol 4-phosphate cytidylyltransferase [Arthrobacter cheniae]RJT79849.1 2-C-methyl-D-erythritol 4-phosphate cytidylyltransferase [Arthrobacter cheniae]
MSEKNAQHPARAGVIVVAAGSGQRLGHGIPKARVLCAGRTLLEHALESVIASGVAGAVVVVLPAGDPVLSAVVAEAALRSVYPTSITAVAGGATRAASVRAGLAALPPTVGVVLVHDAARAITPPAVFQRVAALVSAGASAVIPVLPVVDTIKVVEDGIVTATPDRALLRAVQTPQGFDADALRAAHAGDAAGDATITDDAMLMEASGVPVRVVEGDALAFKVTTPFDLVVAEAVLAAGVANDAAGPAGSVDLPAPARTGTTPTPTSRSSRVPQ